MYHMISVGLDSELLRQLDDLRCVYPEASRAQIVTRLIAEAHANATGWGTQEANDNPVIERALPVTR